ncbi:hypothetical protein P7C70_g7654, partial [Phenoliferia sp. Uapishka_3]
MGLKSLFSRTPPPKRQPIPSTKRALEPQLAEIEREPDLNEKPPPAILLPPITPPLLSVSIVLPPTTLIPFPPSSPPPAITVHHDIYGDQGDEGAYAPYIPLMHSLPPPSPKSATVISRRKTMSFRTQNAPKKEPSRRLTIANFGALLTRKNSNSTESENSSKSEGKTDFREGLAPPES